MTILGAGFSKKEPEFPPDSPQLKLRLPVSRKEDQRCGENYQSFEKGEQTNVNISAPALYVIQSEVHPKGKGKSKCL
jgi:hypothetical protein